MLAEDARWIALGIGLFPELLRPGYDASRRVGDAAPLRYATSASHGLQLASVVK